MRNLCLFLLLLLINNVITAQGRIELSSDTRGVELQASSFEEIKSTFTYKSIESEFVETEKGVFSAITIDKTISGGNYGAPSLPISRELIAVPFGAKPVVKVVGYSVKDYDLADYGIERIYPHQPSMSKSSKPEDRVFYYDESAYQTRAMTNSPKVSVEILGSMRGIQLGALQIEPVSYNPMSNTIRVFNDIKLDVTFEDADIAMTEQKLIETYSPYFDIIYRQLFNVRTINDFYEEHPDLYKSPVKMLVVANRMFEDVMQPWIEWKTQKGFYLNVAYTDEIGTTSEDIKTYIKQQYEAEAPTFVVLFGDQEQLPPSLSSGHDTQRVTDNYYASVDDDYIPDVYCSRMCCETADEMKALIEKILQYEQYTMPDPSYLENVLLIAGYDYWENPKVGQPTMEYANNYYYNEAHGYSNVYKYLDMPYTNCYTHLSQGVGFAHYTAHGFETCWDYPRFAVSDVDNLTNTNKYFWAIGSCCHSGDWGYSSSKSLGEAFICANKKGTWGYIGSAPVTWWWEDYYFSVGATNVTYRMPKYNETTMGCYDALWSDSYNTLSSVMYSGNLAVTYSHLNDYPSSISTRYYYEAYHTLGDGSVMPYRANPSKNDVSHLYAIPVGAESFTINAAPGSYVGISADGVLYGAGLIGDSGMENIQINQIPANKEVTIVVTHPKHIPYIEKIISTEIEGAYLIFDSYQINDDNGKLDSGESVSLSLNVINVGTSDAEDVEVELLSDSEYVVINKNKNEATSIPSGEKKTLNDFSFELSSDVPNKTKIDFKMIITSGDMKWESEFSLAAYAPKLLINKAKIVDDDNNIEPGETATLRFDVKNEGGSDATNVVVQLSSSSSDIIIEDTKFEINTLAMGDVISYTTNVVVPSTMPNGSMYQIGIKASSGSYTTDMVCDLFIGAIIENFETGDFTSHDWQHEGGNNWRVVVVDPYEGSYCAKSGNVTDSNPLSVLKLTVEVFADDEISFYKKLDSPDFDTYSFYIDGEAVDVSSGTLLWELYKHPLTKGVHELKWEMARERNTASTNAVNVAYIDYIKLPPSTVVLLDQVGVTETEKKDIKIYPNPTTGIINIDSDFDIASEIKIYNCQGQLVMSLDNVGKQIDVSTLTSGIYLMVIRNERYYTVERIIMK